MKEIEKLRQFIKSADNPLQGFLLTVSEAGKIVEDNDRLRHKVCAMYDVIHKPPVVRYELVPTSGGQFAEIRFTDGVQNQLPEKKD